MAAQPLERPVIVGGGIAGLLTALELAPRPVLLLVKQPPGDGAATALAQGGIAAAIGDGDDPADHAADTLAAGDGLCDPAIATLVCTAAPQRIAALDRLGVAFDRDAGGRLALGLEGGHGRPRIVHAGGDATGAAVMRALVRAVQATPSITVTQGRAVELLCDDHGIAGLILADAAGRSRHLASRAVVLATGGVGGLFRHTTNPLGALGQGLALAARAGAALIDLEFVQFHPTALDLAGDPLPLATEALRGAGAVLVNDRGERFMAGQGAAELSPRDVVARAVWSEITAGRTVRLDATAALGARFADRFPAVAALCRAAGLDPSRQAMPVRPAAHYHMGGVAVDRDGRTTVPGLWACGEVSATGLHGANRLASNSLLEAAVFARRIADDLAGRVDPPPARLPANTIRPVPAATADDGAVLAEIRTVMTQAAGVVRDGPGLAAAAARLRTLLLTTAAGSCGQDAAIAALLIVSAALQRQESRGSHWRRDFTRPVAPVRRPVRYADIAMAHDLPPAGATPVPQPLSTVRTFSA